MCPWLKLQEALPQLSSRISPPIPLQLQLSSESHELPSLLSKPIFPKLKLHVCGVLQAEESSDANPIWASESTQLQADSPLQTESESKTIWSPLAQ
jgi:hypothetical protein